MTDNDGTTPFPHGSRRRPGAQGRPGGDRSNAHRDDTENGRDSVTVDMEAVRSDDRLLDALSRNQVPGGWDTDPADQQLAQLLAGWRHELDATPMPLGPTLDEVEAEIARERRTGSRHTAMRRLRVVSGAAAVAVVAFGAVTVLAQNSNPGDPLWNVKEAMFGSAASATVASADAQSNLEKAEQALSTGDRRQAAQYLVEAQKKVGGMSGDDSRQRMRDWAQRLAEQVGPIPDNPLTALTTLPSVSGLPPIQIPSDVISAIVPTTVPDLRNQMRARVKPSTPPAPSTPAVPSTPAPTSPTEDATTTTTTTAPVPSN